MAHELEEMTWEEVRDLDRARAVAILPAGAIEAHGPHLPLGADVVIARGMARAGAAILASRGTKTLVLPPLPYTAAPFGARFPGTISLPHEIVSALLTELTRELTRQGFRALAVANAHLDPDHLSAIAEAERRAREGGMIPLICPNLTKRPWALRLTEEFQSGACHAGRYETSILLAERPDLVREKIRRGLSPQPRSLSTAIRSGLRTFEEAGGERAYFGSPAEATAEEGRASIEALGAILADSVTEALAPGRRP